MVYTLANKEGVSNDLHGPPLRYARYCDNVILVYTLWFVLVFLARISVRRCAIAPQRVPTSHTRSRSLDCFLPFHPAQAQAQAQAIIVAPSERPPNTCPPSPLRPVRPGPVQHTSALPTKTPTMYTASHAQQPTPPRRAGTGVAHTMANARTRSRIYSLVARRRRPRADGEVPGLHVCGAVAQAWGHVMLGGWVGIMRAT